MYYKLIDNDCQVLLRIFIIILRDEIKSCNIKTFLAPLVFVHVEFFFILDVFYKFILPKNFPSVLLFLPFNLIIQSSFSKKS